MIQPQLWVLAGPNGAGKSTIARRYIIGRIPFVNADDIARDLDPVDVNSMTAHMRAGRIALELREGYLLRNETFAMETTLTGRSELALMRRARKAGYKVNVIFVGIGNVAISAARVRTRVLLGGHDVPKEAILRRYGRSMAALADALTIAHRSWVFDNSGGRRRLLLKREMDRVSKLASGLPNWAVDTIPPAFRTTPEESHTP
ncbi:zeta toxin family protein [Azospirillum sp. YIM B02556]|uniref:Zeta toxin family protein n=1 Tax=Azospirillum endophyticum TaxID=2800326 RepID=A0ABS1F5G3_9PROT|nr:AAA family ATPase [Azospirillum endophyticum]MBK1838638.1 zeta toxin family protein [Azospirillum endophyticum]